MVPLQFDEQEIFSRLPPQAGKAPSPGRARRARKEFFNHPAFLAILGLCLILLRCPHESEETIGEPSATVPRELLGAWNCRTGEKEKPQVVRMFVLDFDGRQLLAILDGDGGEQAFMRLVPGTFQKADILNVEELKAPASHRFAYLRYTASATSLHFKIMEDPPGQGKLGMPHKEYLELLSRDINNRDLYSDFWSCTRDAKRRSP